ncbi:MAG TPA: diguanylate cyclase [Candidatus Limnocylindrales bacterium]|nr:diguanylate cyclase [Candidatus Limnocylindrales bacterium]
MSAARVVAHVIAAAVVYALVARISLLFVLEPQHVAGIWPPAGIALGMLLVAGPGAWPAIATGVAIAVAAANLIAGVPALPTAGFVVANTVEPVLAAWALRRVGFTSLATLRGVGQLLGYGALAAPAVGALIGATFAAWAANAPFVPTYVSWLLSDAGGVLAVAPAILLARHRERVRLDWRTGLEAVAIGTLVTGLTCTAFLPVPLGFQLAASPIFLLLVVTAVRFRVVGATLATLAVAVIATAGTIAGYGPLARLNPSPAVQIGQVQVLVATTFLIAFVTAATISERRAAAAKLAERAATNERITAFARAVARTLEPEATFGEIVRAAGDAVSADVVVLSASHGDREAHRIVGAAGAPSLIGRTVEPGDGCIGAVIRDGTTILMDRAEPGERATSTQDVFADRTLAMACVPILTDGAVTATLGVGRLDLASPFTTSEARALELMADLASLALRNAILYARAQELSIRDELTGLPNRRYFATSFDRMAAQRSRQVAASRDVVSVVLFDLDHFGAVNKERGHATGDRLLARFGELLATSLRRADVVARYGGEEFVAILLGTRREDAVRIADEVRSAFEQIVVDGDDGLPIRCTVSAGVAEVEAGEASLSALLPAADVALAMAKRAGRNMVAAA